MTDSPDAQTQAGDSHAVEAMVTFCRSELSGYAYLNLGPFQDVDDLVEDEPSSARQALDRLDGLDQRVLLDLVANGMIRPTPASAWRPRATTEPATRSPFANAVPCGDPWWIEPFPDTLIDDIDESATGSLARYGARESMTLSFVVSLQHLPAQQRAVLVLNDVLGFSITETAEMLDTTSALVDHILQLARTQFNSVGDPEEVNLGRSEKDWTVVTRFVDAFERGDLEAVVGLLADDAKVTMPPEPIELRGRPVIADFYRSLGFWGQPLKVVPTRANHQPAFAYYLPDPVCDLYRFSGILVLDVTNNQISAITRFGDRGLIARFGLPRTVPRA